MKNKLLVIIKICFSLTIAAQSNQLVFKQLTTSDGLSQSWVRCIMQDDLGYIWIGTEDGLNRYDGYDFKVYLSEPGVDYSIGNMVINHILKSKSNELMISTDNGIFIYKQDEDKFCKFPFLKDKSIQCTLIDYKNNYWFGGYNGLFKFNSTDSSIVSFFNDDANSKSLSNNRIRCLMQDSENNLWIGTENGLCLFNEETSEFNIYRENNKKNSIAGNNIWALLEDNNKNIWIAILQTGVDLIKYKDKNIANLKFTHVLDGSPISLLIDHSNKLWVGNGSGRGLRIINLNSFNPEKPTKDVLQYYHSPNFTESLSDNSIYSLFEDSFGDMWIGTFGGGVNYFSERTKKFNKVSVVTDKEHSLSGNLVNCFLEENNYLWVGTEMGLDRLDKNTGIIKHFNHDPKVNSSIGANSIYAIYKDRLNNLWVGSWDGGLSKFNYQTENFSNYLPNNKPGSISSKNVFSICEDKSGNLWIGTINGGLNKFDYKTGLFKTYQHNPSNPKSLYTNSVCNIHLANDGKLYLAAYDAMEVYNPTDDSFTHYVYSAGDPASISGGYILSIFEDSKDQLWIATNMGLNYFDKKTKKFTHYTKQNGLPNNSIKSILEDSHGNFWIGTNGGLALFYNAIGIPDSSVIKTYNSFDGLPSNEFAIRAAYKNKDGRFYFGTSKGFIHFDPDSIYNDQVEPKIVLTCFSLLHTTANLNDQNMSLKNEINFINEVELKYNQSDFEIKFAAINYLNPNKNKYKYMLEGYEEGWHEVGNQRIATYTNIAPGIYNFHLMASNSDGIWCQKPKSLKIIINPPWWNTILFRISSISIIIVLLISGYRFRVSILKKQKVLLEKTVKERTAELINLNSELKDRQQEIGIQNEELSQHRENLQHLVEEKTRELETAKIQAEASDKLKSAFLANMSHEIRTPMNAIVGFSSLLNVSDLNETDRSRYIDIISKNSESLLVLINDIIDISLIEANQLVLSMSNFDINTILREEESYFKLKNEKNLDIDFICPSKDKSLWVYNDSIRLRQVLSNLLNNAYKYTESGWIKFGYNADEEKITFYVSDSGIGIEQLHMENIFNHFYKIEKEENKLYRGAGIGLSICRKLIEQMGGDIWVESKIKEGSSFYFTLPFRHIKPQKTKSAEPNYNYDFSNVRVVVAEDDPTNYELVKTILKKHNIDPIWAQNGKEVVDIVTKDHLIGNCIVLMDIKMPLMDGIEANKRIKLFNSNIRVIALTAYAQSGDKERILNENFDDYIAKPLNPEELLNKISKFVAKDFN